MGKPKRERSLSDSEAQAVARNLRVSPRKLNLVAGLIRGKPVDAAIADLEFSRKRIAQDVKKCVMSAVANAENNQGIDPATLIVDTAYVDEGPTLKRFQPRAQGRAFRIRKRTCHITIELVSVDANANQSKSAKGRTR